MTVTDERHLYGARLRSILERLADTIEAVPASKLDERLLADGSTPAQIMAHVAGSVRASVIGIAGGMPVERDRPHEFEARGGDPSMIGAGLRALANEIDTTLGGLPDRALDELVTPPQSLLGLQPQQEMARRAAVISAIAHAAEHLGELMLIKDTFAERGR